jgi:hypothetical protein
MKTRAMIPLRVQPTLKRRLAARARREGTTSTDVATRAIEGYLEAPAGRRAPFNKAVRQQETK